MNRVSQLLLTLTLVTMSSCGDSTQPTEHNTEQTSIAVPLSKTAASEIASAELVITGEGFTSVTQELTVSGATISGVVERLLPGLNRTFTMNAYDAAGVLVYSGSTTVDIADGEQAQVSINLIRVDAPFAPVEILHQLPDGTMMPMMLVPAGEFTRGSGDHPNPFQTIEVSEFHIGKLEVTHAQAARWLVARGDNNYPEAGPFINTNRVSAAQGLKIPEDARIPVVSISWYGASEYCLWAGLRLPTEAEWEKAARGQDKRVFPWGARIDTTRANYLSHTSPNRDENCLVNVGSYPTGASPYGVLDMAGNAEEWVSDWFAIGHYYSSDLVDPTGASGHQDKVMRGGHCSSYPSAVATFVRAHDSWSHEGGYTGFRCVRD